MVGYSVFNIRVQYSYQLSPPPPVPLPFGPYFWLLLCLEGLFSYWPKGRAMDKFYCFQANGENFRHLKSWRINFKIKFFIFPKQQLDFFFFLVLISLCHFWCFMNAATKLSVLTGKVNMVTVSARHFPYKRHTFLCPFPWSTHTDFPCSTDRWLVLKWIYHWQLLGNGIPVSIQRDNL